MQVVGKLVDRRIDQFLVGLKVSVVEQYFTGFRLIESVHLFARLACKQQEELGGSWFDLEKEVFRLFLVHGVDFKEKPSLRIS